MSSRRYQSNLKLWCLARLVFRSPWNKLVPQWHRVCLSSLTGLSLHPKFANIETCFYQHTRSALSFRNWIRIIRLKKLKCWYVHLYWRHLVRWVCKEHETTWVWILALYLNSYIYWALSLCVALTGYILCILPLSPFDSPDMNVIMSIKIHNMVVTKIEWIFLRNHFTKAHA